MTRNTTFFPEVTGFDQSPTALTTLGLTNATSVAVASVTADSIIPLPKQIWRVENDNIVKANGMECIYAGLFGDPAFRPTYRQGRYANKATATKKASISTVGRLTGFGTDADGATVYNRPEISVTLTVNIEGQDAFPGLTGVGRLAYTLVSTMFGDPGTQEQNAKDIRYGILSSALSQWG